MKLLISIVLFLFYSVDSNSQVIDPSISWDGLLEYQFHPEFISQKNIKRIDCEYSSKKPNERIKSSLERKFYEFDSLGLLTEYYSQKKIGTLDLIKHDIYNYNELGSIISKTQKDEVGYFRKHYEYLGDSIEITTFRSESFNPTKEQQAFDSTLINSELKVQSDSNKFTYNRNLIHTRTEKETRKENGLKDKSDLHYLLSNQLIQKEYFHNKEGFISEIIYKSSSNVKSFKYYYDENDVLKKIETWKSDECLKRLEFIYNANGWVESSLLQNAKSNLIIITKYTYTFHS